LKYIAWFKELSKDSISLVGGKGANLGEMYNAGLPIPPGFVVTASAYKEFIEKTNIKDEILNRLKNLDTQNTAKLQEIAKEIQDLIINTEMLPELKAEIIEAYEALSLGNNVHPQEMLDNKKEEFVAVRSSATAEDLPSISEDEHVLVQIDNNIIYKKMKEVYNLVGKGNDYNILIPSLCNNKIKWSKVKEIYRHKANKTKLYKLITETGREITISPNHTLIVLDETSLEQREVASVNELKGNERVPVVNKLPLPSSLKQKKLSFLDYLTENDVVLDDGLIKIKNPNNNWKIQNGLIPELTVDSGFAYFLGVYAAEGSTYKDNCITITNSSKEVMQRIIEFFASLNLYKSQNINRGTLRIYCKSFVRFLHKIAGKPNNKITGKGKICKVKEVPNFIFGWSKDLIGQFLRGCFDGDGYVSKQTIEYCSTSEMLIGGIVKLLEILGIEFYLAKNKTNIVIPLSQAKKFGILIGFNNKSKLMRLQKLINKYKEMNTHPRFKNSWKISKLLAKKIRKDIELNLPKTEVEVILCPSCNMKINQTSRYRERERYYCHKCKKAFYSDQVKKSRKLYYVNYDEKGKFTKGSTPWNKGLVASKTYSVDKLISVLNKYGTKNLDIFNDSVTWDKIKKIEPINYDGWVYDFVVPESQNFAAGVGGIVTHNSASFAGQQATFLNVRGREQLIRAVSACWASLFTARAIYYRVRNKFDHSKVYIAVVIQKMVDSDMSGVMFSVNPATNDPNTVIVEAVYGLGEAIVSGAVNPDHYEVNKETNEITNITVREQEWGFFRNPETGKTEKRPITDPDKSSQVINNKQIKELARYACKIEEHYNKAQDIEWAIEKGNIYIVQSRAVTTLKKEVKAVEELKGEVILTGQVASRGLATGPIKIIYSLSELSKIQPGDVMVTRMTTPDMVPAMEKAAAIITDEGGATCFPSYTKVLTSNGIKEISQIYKSLQKDEEVKVLTLNNHLKPEWKDVIASHKRIAQIIRISVSQTGRSSTNTLDLTQDHKMMLFENRMLCKKPINEVLDKNLAISTIDKIPDIVKSNEKENKLSYLIGAIYTDGHIQLNRRRGRIAFVQKNTEQKRKFINQVVKNFKDLFNYDLKVRTRNNTSIIRGHRFTSIANAANAYTYSLKSPSQILLEKYENLIPWIMETDEENICAFLSGVIDGDGSFHKKHGNRVHIYTSDEILIQAIVLGCLRLGIQPVINDNRLKCKNIQITEKIEKVLKHSQRFKPTNKTKAIGVKLFSAKQLLSDIINDVNVKGKIRPYVDNNLLINNKILERISKLAKYKDGVKLRQIASSPLRMKRVSQVDSLPETEVYNLTVEDNHNFVVFTRNLTPVWVANCHAAIVSREMGTPCIVGTVKATKLLKEGEIVTVDATHGKIYKGKVIEEKKVEIKEAEPSRTKTKIKLIMDLPKFAERAAATGADGVGLVRLEIMIAQSGVHPAYYLKDGNFEPYIQMLVDGIGKIARAFKDKPVWVRTSDMRTDEYRNLKGAENEPKETDPMIGWHAIRRALDQPEILKAEFTAIKRLHDVGLKNVGVMIPFLITTEELKKAKAIMRSCGLEPIKDVDFGVMIETPASCWIIEDICNEGISFISFGTNDLTQLTLGVDRNNERIQKLFNELHPAILSEIALVIKTCKKHGVQTSICGQAGSRPEMARFLVKQGIDSISVNIDALDEIRKAVSVAEKQ